MTLEEFLARVIPAGNHIITSRVGPGKPWIDWTHADLRRAAWSIRQGIKDGCEVYHALSAFATAVAMTSRAGKPYFNAQRRQNNVQWTRVLVIDADVKRVGDKKDPSTVFADRRAAVTWLANFVAITKLPFPNLAIDSGYGYHWYWVLDTPLARVDWQPLANALKSAMLANQWVGDTSPTVDCARVLRPPESYNLKSGTPVPVKVLNSPQLNAADYPVALIQTALAPWIGAAHASQATGTHSSSAGGATISSIGPRPAHIPPPGTTGPAPGLNQNAHAGITRREYLFSRIATQCEQVKRSLAIQGNGDLYPLWYRGHLTLAHFCHDGLAFVHEIGKGDAKYTPTGTDDAVARIAREVADKGFGAPTCLSYDSNRQGVCNTCPWQGKINSPYSLGIEDGDYPDGWRRGGNPGHTLERYTNKEWIPVIAGNFYMPQLEEIPTGGFALVCLYEDTGRHSQPIRVSNVDALDRNQIGQLLATQGVSVDRHNAGIVGDFMVAWITKLRALRVERSDSVKPFGWAFDNMGKRIGATIAGTLYRTDGTNTIIPGGDAEVRVKYTPKGDIQVWRDAAKLFEHGREDMQVLIATTFGAPLMQFTGLRGLVWNFWSQGSGVGKTSAMKVANAVWGSPEVMQSNADTPNAVLHLLSETRIIAKLWDELRVRREWQGDFVELLFTVPQGKERARMAPDTTLRPVGEWHTMVTFTCNRSIMDYITQEAAGTDAGVARAFEIFLPKLGKRYSSTADQIIAGVETNYGHAGRLFIEYVAANADKIQIAISQFKAALDAKLQPEDVERFYVAGIAAVMVGAAIAKRLKLFDFETDKMQACLERVFLSLRQTRTGQTLMASTGVGFDLEQVLSQFVAAHADQRIITETFGQLGKSTGVVVMAAPRANEVRVQIADIPQVMRIDRKILLDFLHTSGLPGRAMINQMVADWSALEVKRTLAGGTQYAGGQMWVLDIPLTGSLAGYLTAKPDPAATAPPRASPGKTLAGNQPAI